MSPPSAIEVEAITDTQGVTVPDPFLIPVKVNEVRGRRKIHAKSQWGVAAHATSDQFKHSSGLKNKPMAKRWDRE